MAEAPKKTVRLLAPILVAGEHRGAGETVDVDLALALRLVGAGRAVAVDQAEPAKDAAPPPGAAGKQTTAKGLTAGGAGAPLIKRG